MGSDLGWRLDVGWKNYWAMACHLAWSWRNKEKHDDAFFRPTLPAEYVMRRLRMYCVADKAMNLKCDVQRNL
ncbi:hypothetical protein A2U01_0052204, partial [Trifolium medium]|nr:hypothetical protein [Trifolium medium]